MNLAYTPQNKIPQRLRLYTCKIMDANYYTTYLKAYLTDTGDARKDNEDFISARADAASEEYEVQRRAGAPPACAQELAMAVLMEGLT